MSSFRVLALPLTGTAMRPSLLRRAVTLCLSVAMLAVATGCDDPFNPGGGADARLNVTALLNSAPVATMVVEVTGEGIASPLVFNLAISGGADDDRFFGRTLGAESVGAVERQAERVGVIQAVGFIQPGVHFDDVARLNRAWAHDRPVAASRARVGVCQPRECRLLTVAFPAGRIDVEHAPAAGGCGFRARSHRRRLDGLTGDAVGVAKF